MLKLLIDPVMGMAGDMFCAALLNAGAPRETVIAGMTAAARPLGQATITLQNVKDTATCKGFRLDIRLNEKLSYLSGTRARDLLQQAIAHVNLSAPYAEFARRALEILIEAERAVHNHASFLEDQAQTITLTPIGVARTPYEHEAPYQPLRNETSGEFFIEIKKDLVPALSGLESFSHILVLSYLHRSEGFNLYVAPPWQKDKGTIYGLFATRSPNRPNPIGLTRARILDIVDNRIYTGNLDLFDGTPILDIKPFIATLDNLNEEEHSQKENGWLSSELEHLELHRKGIPHKHDEEAVLHEAMDILIDVIGAALALESLNVDLDDVTCLSPVFVGGGAVNFSHGLLKVPAPATKYIMDVHHIPFESGPVETELLTPTGAAILAALKPKFIPRTSNKPQGKVGMGMGQKKLERPNVLRVYLQN